MEKTVEQATVVNTHTAEVLSQMAESVEKMLAGDLSALIERLYYLDPQDMRKYADDYDKFSRNTRIRVGAVKLQVSTKRET